GLVAGVRLAQAMVDVGRTQRAREAAEQVELLDGAARARQRRELRARGLQATDRRFQRDVPGHLLPVIAFAHHRRAQAIGAVDAFVTVTVAVGDPGFVDGLVG